MATRPQKPDPVQLNLLEENSKWVKENYPELSKSMQDAAKEEKIDRARAYKVENEEFKDKRVKPSPLVVEAELAKMKELTAPKSKGGGGGGGGGTGMPKTGLNKKPEYKSGGKVSSASKRADGCAIRGKTRA
jgi:hypothetical protein